MEFQGFNNYLKQILTIINISFSDGFFQLENIPEKSVVVGAGYIGVELAGILNALGSKTSLVVRYDSVLRNFDEV